MSDNGRVQKPQPVELGIKEMKIKSGDSSEEEAYGTIRVGKIKEESAPASGTNSPMKLDMKHDVKSITPSPRKARRRSTSPETPKNEHMQAVGGDITVKQEPGQLPKLARTASQKVMARSSRLFDDLPDVTDEATSVFQVLTECTYSAKYLGTTEHAMDCDCAEEWGKIE